MGKEETQMKVVNPIGRKADDTGAVNSSCRCSLKGTYGAGQLRTGCTCYEPSTSGGQIAHIVYQGH